MIDLKGAEKENCLANGDTCKTCIEGDKCNHHSDFLKCFMTDDPITNASEPHQFDTKSSPKICQNYNDKCFLKVLENDVVMRGCVKEYGARHDLSVDSFIEAANNLTFEVCSTYLCNGTPLKPSFCYVCNSDSEKNCIRNPKPQSIMNCPLELRPSSCYHFIYENYVERGCLSAKDKKDREFCESDSENCKICEGNECNKLEKFQSCFWNNETQLVNQEGDVGVSKVCREYNDECFIIASNNSIRRGCVSEAHLDIDIINDCSDSNVCEKCTGYECNNRTIESEYCIACSSGKDNHTFNKKYGNCKFDFYPDSKVKCTASLKKRGCFLHRASAESSVERGCVVSLDLEEQHKCQNASENSSCKICMGEYCNIKRAFQTCIACDSNIDGEACIEANRSWKTAFKLKNRQCPNYMDQCYTRVENGIVSRNCTDDNINSIQNCENDPKHCKVYSNSLGNENPIERNICVVCDSDIDKRCRPQEIIKDEDLFKEFPLTINEEGCYHFVDKNTNRHIRGIKFSQFSF